ncbi:MAG: OmpA family protein, partial [Balneolales bacterium]
MQRQTVSGTGMQMGSVLGQTSYGHENPNFSIRLYTQRTLTGNLVGEAGLSLAMISGKDYKTRLMPLDYRFQYRFRERLFVTSTAVQPYIYAGMGVLYQQPIAVGTEDDPLTREAGTRIPSTAMFGFDGGLSPIMPLGLGASFPTGHSTNVTVNLGYNQTFSDFSFSDPSVNFGYWSLSVGLSFNRLSSRSNRPGREQPAARPPIYMNMAQLQAKPVLPLQMPGSITFALHSSELSETARGRLIEISRILKSDQTLRLRITGHTDVTGTDPLNELISQSRARATRLQLIDMGIDPERIEYSWYGDIISLADNSTKEGREQNRRVEFEMVRDAAPRAREAVAPDEKPISYEIGKPLFGRKSIAFGWLELQPVGHTEGRLMQAANLLVRDSSVS